jgi:lipopolysaccharide biosynthesis glycosyltransferase
VVLDSILTHTSRPVRAFVLCREHTYPDFVRMAALFPTVSFVWLPTDEAEYGSLRGLLRYTTVATMDRLLLPDLLPEVGRIIHHDLDALCLADLAELYDIDLAGTPIAGCRQEQLKTISGYRGFMNKAERFGADPTRGQHYLRLSHTRHQFDFDMVNAGILVLDLELMRTDQFCQRFLPYVEHFHMNDQGVLNHYAGNNRIELPRGWNWRPWLGTIPQPKIAHWAGPFKPWQPSWVQARDQWRTAETRVAERYARAGL